MSKTLIIPSPLTWTLRFKNNRTTILLHADPLQPFSQIRATLLLAIQSSNPAGDLNGTPIPQNSDDVILGRAVDPNDLSQGWETISGEVPEADGVGEVSNGKGKGKAVAGQDSTSSRSKGNQLKDCPQGSGIRDNAIIAFKFRSGEENDALGAHEQGDGIALPISEEWDVVVPTTEETYGDGADDDEGLG